MNKILTASYKRISKILASPEYDEARERILKSFQEEDDQEKRDKLFIQDRSTELQKRGCWW